MMRRLCLVVFLAASASLMSTSAYADFGRPDWIGDVRFGGSGIVGSNSQLVYDEVDLGKGQFVRLALMAHGRYAYSQTVDVNTQRYYVETGKFGGTGSDKDYARWNFDWYVASNVTRPLGVRLSYDFDPGVNSDPLNYYWFITLAGETEDSWNLAMNFLSFSSSILLRGVSLEQKTQDGKDLGFNPNVNGEYTFKLEVFDATFKTRYGGIEMRVNAVPEPATLVGLASLGASGLGAVVLRRRKKA